MIDVPNTLVEIDRLTANFHDGSLPSWISDESSGGSVSVQDASDAGGYAQLATGTGSSGDGAEIQPVHDYDPSAYDAIEMFVEFEASHDHSSEVDIFAPSLVGVSSGFLQWMVHFNNFETDSISEGSNFAVDATDRLRASILWFTERELAQLRVYNTLWRAISGDDLPSASQSFSPRVLIRTNDTSVDRTLNVYRFGLTYYEDNKVR